MNVTNIDDYRSGLRAPAEPSARISISLRRQSRACRREIIASTGYRSLRLGAIDRLDYANLLYTHHAVRRALEVALESLHGRSVVANAFTGERKAFELERFLSAEDAKSALILEDIVALTGSAPNPRFEPAAALPLIHYLQRVRQVYSIALLGVLYTLEETVTYAGPAMAAALDEALSLEGRATRYLGVTPARRERFAAFRAALDEIGDLQTQVNVVTASTLSYRLYKGLLGPRALRGGALH